jgi:peptide/nickel transport system permease protein
MRRSVRGRVSARSGALLLLALCLAGLVAPLVAPADPLSAALPDRLRPPSEAHLLGHDALGRDVLSRLLYGARVSFVVGVATLAISLAVGIALGAAAGWAGGWLDEALVRVIDVFLAFPGLLLAIALAAVLGPSLANVVLALSVLGWPAYARLTRAEVASLRGQEFVHAAAALGARPLRIVVAHILPLALPTLLVQATFGMAGAIVAEASLSFLGLGVAPPTPSWGSMIAEGRSFLLVAPHVTIFPGLALALTVLALQLLGDGLRDALDVRDADGARR